MPSLTEYVNLSPVKSAVTELCSDAFCKLIVNLHRTEIAHMPLFLPTNYNSSSSKQTQAKGTELKSCRRCLDKKRVTYKDGLKNIPSINIL